MEHTHQKQQQQQHRQPRMVKTNTVQSNNNTTNNNLNSSSKDIVDLTFSPPEDNCLPPPSTTKECLRRWRPRNNDDNKDDNSVELLISSSSSSSRRTKKRSRTSASTKKRGTAATNSDDDDDDEALYEVEKIVAHRTDSTNMTFYKTRWKGWSSANDTWEPAHNVASTGHIDKYERSKLQNQSIVGTPGVALIQYEDGEREIVNMTNENFRIHHPDADKDEEDATNKTLELMEMEEVMRDYNLISTGKWIDILWKHAKIFFPCKIINWTPLLVMATKIAVSTTAKKLNPQQQQQQSATKQINNNKADSALIANKGKRQQQRHDDSLTWLSTSKSQSLHAAGGTSSSGRGFLLPTTAAMSTKPSSSLSLLSSREAKVLEQQRRVANLLGGDTNNQRQGIIHLDAADDNDNDGNNAVTTSIEYAGTLKPNDAAETLARARQKRQHASSSSSSSNNESSSTMTSAAGGSQNRPSASKFTNKGSLASLLLSNTSTAKYMQPNGPKKLLKHYEKVVPDDYWKNMTSWDILGELNDKMMSTTTTTTTKNTNNNGINNTKKQQQQSLTATTTTITLPDVFETYREYCALWAPLLLEEARAQLLSEIISDIPYWRKAKIEKGPVRVFLEPNKADLNSSLDIIGVRVKNVLSNSSEYKERSFMVHDIVQLMREESFIWDAYDGKLLLPRKSQSKAARQPSRFGIVGYIEYGRRSMEGLTINVAKDLWSDIGTSEMVLIKLGCNITSLREFTALCRMDNIPLSDYILSAKMSAKKSTNFHRKNTVDTLSDEHLEKKDILSMMGGSSALGKGFAEYASQKFNLSQLGAISASAQDYGNGGFTLIKGPPGTGKVSINI